jgi:serine/threonine protein kinase
VHLLERMLAFDPGRRISAEEALSHEYFAPLETAALDNPGDPPLALSGPNPPLTRPYPPLASVLSKSKCSCWGRQ